MLTAPGEGLPIQGEAVRGDICIVCQIWGYAQMWPELNLQWLGKWSVGPYKARAFRDGVSNDGTTGIHALQVMNAPLIFTTGGGWDETQIYGAGPLVQDNLCLAPSSSFFEAERLS